MRNLDKLFLIILLFLSTRASAQCPVASFSLPDTVCAGISIPIQNNSSGSNLKYEWDFNSKDMTSAPIGYSLGSFPGTLSNTLGVDFINISGNYYGLTINFGGGLSVLNFGSSLDNAPIVIPLSNLAGLGNPHDISIVEDSGLYFALIHTYGGKVYRLEFGNSLLNTPTAVQINVNSGLFNAPHYHTLYKTDTELFLLIANYTGGTITVIDFNGSVLNNNPLAGNISVPVASPISIAVGHDCSGYYGFVSHFTSPLITRIDFGPTISSTPVQIMNLNTSGISFHRKINLINDGYNWFLLAVSNDGRNLHRFSFGSSLNNASPLVSTYNGLSAFNAGCFAFNIKKFESTIKGIVPNGNTGEITGFSFPEINLSAPANSTQISPIVTFNGNGYYFIDLQVTDSVSGVKARYRDSIFIRKQPVSDFNYSPLCRGSISNFINTASSPSGNITDYIWSFGNSDSSFSPNPTYSYLDTGIYNVTLTVADNHGCSNSHTKQVEVFEPPTAQIGFTGNTCMGTTVQLIDSSNNSGGSISNWTWDFGDGTTSNSQNPLHEWIIDGSPDITLIIESDNGCRDTAQSTITIIPGPIADFNLSHTCIGDTVRFFNQTNSPANISVAYTWDFGDGTNSLTTNPVHQYSSIQPGEFEVLLIASGSSGCTDTLTRTIRIGNPAISDFILSSDSICVMSKLTLNDVSLIPPGETVKAIYWDFGNGGADTNATGIQTQYPVAGNYQISLSVETKTSCRSSIQKNIVVLENPEADFTTANVCFGNPVQFNQSCTTPAGTNITSWNWDFGDTTFSFLQNPSHEYASADSFNVRLTITHNLGCSDSIIIPVQTYPIPLANFAFSKACTDQPIQFVDSTTVEIGTITEWDWNYGDGSSTDTINHPNHIYNQTAAYLATLIVSSNFGCKDTISKLITVEQSPEFFASGTNVCSGTPVSFDINFLTPPPNNAGYLWDFGDSTSSVQPSPIHLYSSPGTFNTTLTLSDLDNGCSTSQTLSNTVYEKPIAGFAFENVCTGIPFDIKDTSIITNGVITGWEWNAGNYGLFNTSNIQFTSLAADTFSIILTVSTDDGCQDSVSQTLISFPKPNVSFSTNVIFGSPPLNVIFTNNSSDGNYEWDFGDGSSSSGINNPSHVYSDTGIYYPMLTVINEYGCEDSSSQELYVLTPITDLGITALSYYLRNDQWIMELELQNHGNTFIDWTEIKIDLQYRNSVIELISNLNLKPGESRWMTLNTRYPNDGIRKPDLSCAEVISVNGVDDMYAENNRKCSSLDDSFIAYPIYPNPGKGMFYLPINVEEKCDINLTLFSSTGQIIQSTIRQSLFEGYNTLEFSIEQYPKGIYLLEIESEKLKEIYKIVKY